MLTINISETVWTLVCFLLLYLGLKKFLYEPIMRFMDERNARIDAGFTAEREAQEQVRGIQEEAQRQRDKLSDEAKQSLSASKAELLRESERLIHEEKARSREEKQRAVSADTSADTEKIALELPELARRLADRVLEN